MSQVLNLEDITPSHAALQQRAPAAQGHMHAEGSSERVGALFYVQSPAMVPGNSLLIQPVPPTEAAVSLLEAMGAELVLKHPSEQAEAGASWKVWAMAGTDLEYAIAEILKAGGKTYSVLFQQPSVPGPNAELCKVVLKSDVRNWADFNLSPPIYLSPTGHASLQQIAQMAQAQHQNPIALLEGLLSAEFNKLTEEQQK